jgi:hypothetical protein
VGLPRNSRLLLGRAAVRLSGQGGPVRPQLAEHDSQLASNHDVVRNELAPAVCAGPSQLATTFDNVPYDEVGRMLVPCLSGRRVFVSACQMAPLRLRAKSCLTGDYGDTLLNPLID